MKLGRAGHEHYDIPGLEESEFSLGIPPCPMHIQPEQAAQTAKIALRQSEPEYGSPGRGSSSADRGNDDSTPALTVGWAIALALAVAVVILISGG